MGPAHSLRTSAHVHPFPLLLQHNHSLPAPARCARTRPPPERAPPPSCASPPPPHPAAPSQSRSAPPDPPAVAPEGRVDGWVGVGPGEAAGPRLGRGGGPGGLCTGGQPRMCCLAACGLVSGWASGRARGAGDTCAFPPLPVAPRRPASLECSPDPSVSPGEPAQHPPSWAGSPRSPQSARQPCARRAGSRAPCGHQITAWAPAACSLHRSTTRPVPPKPAKHSPAATQRPRSSSDPEGQPTLLHRRPAAYPASTRTHSHTRLTSRAGAGRAARCPPAPATSRGSG